MSRICIVAALVGSWACGHPAAPHPGSAGTAFVDVTVVPMDRDGELAHQTVIVRDGRIAAIGPVATTPVPAGVARVAGAGKFLAPGLADMHAHTYDPRQLALFVAHGVTTIRVMWGDATAIGARDAIRGGASRLAPSIYTAGPIVDGNPPVWPGSLGVTSVDEARAAVAAQRRAGFDFVKVYARLTPEEYAAIVDEAAKQKLPVMGHVAGAVGLAGALAAKQVTIEHLDGYVMFAQRADSPVKPDDFKARIGAWKSVDPAKQADAVTRTVAAGTWNCPTLIVQDRISHLDHPPDPSGAAWAYVSKPTLARWNPAMDFRFRSWTAEDFETARGGNAWRGALVKQLSDAGAGILAGTDVGNPWLVPGASLHEELGLLVGAGLTPAQALRAATANPAKLFHAEGQFGTVVVGARADLVLLDGDPLADIANTQKLAGVMLRGRWLPRAELDAMRAHVADIYADKASRFDASDDPPHAVRALYRDVNQLSGEERLTLSTKVGEDGVLDEETRMDGEPDTKVSVRLDGTGLNVTGEGLAISVQRDGTHAKIFAKLGGDDVSLDEPLAADEVFGGPWIATDVLHYRELMKLPVGGSATVKLAVLEIAAKMSLSHIEITAKRVADATHTVAGRTVPVRVFEYTAGRDTSKIELDERGWPVETPTALRQR